MKRSIEFIEANIKEKLTPEMVAVHNGYSLYHFCRVFQVCTGTTVMEYIRKRRLSLAAVELFQGKKIIDIALDYGFETQSGFAKSFRKEYGYSPSEYATRMAGVQSYLSGADAPIDYADFVIPYVIVNRPAFKVAGYGIKTNLADGSYTRDIAAFWNQYNINGWEHKLYQQLQPPKHGEIGICVPDSKDQGSLMYLLGVVVENFARVTDDMITLEVPEARYAIFTTPPVDVTEGGKEGKANQVDFPKAIRLTWKYIFEEWFQHSGYVFDESKLDFEWYDERCHFRRDTVMDIYIPVIQQD